MDTTHPDNEREMRARPGATPRPNRVPGRGGQAAHGSAATDHPGKWVASAQNRAGRDRLTQCLSTFLTRRGFALAGTSLVVALGNPAMTDAKKKRKKKKKSGSKNSNPTPAQPACSTACGSGQVCQNGSCICPNNAACARDCCASTETCIRGECCAHGQVCDGDCCGGDEVCANRSPGGAKGCCANPLVVRGETCCPTGSLSTRLNCGSYQCAYALSGTGPGGCDLWCKVGYEGAGCGPGVPGFPTGDPNRGCCCGQIASPGVCTYPIPGQIPG